MDLKTSIRPVINTIDQSKDSTSNEVFQNNTLRPILKLQHELLKAFFSEYLKQRKTEWSKLSQQKQEAFIKSAFSNDSNFKGAITHLIIGHFTVEEFLVYTDNSKEFRKRILQMAHQRISGEFI